MLTALRGFWRFLDQYEKTFQLASPVTLDSIGEVIASAWMHPPTDDAWSYTDRNVMSVGSILRLAHTWKGSSDSFFWPAVSMEPKELRDVADEAQARSALTLLKREAQAIYARWRRADELSAKGRNLLDCNRDKRGRLGFVPNEADFHRTFRDFIERTSDPLPLSERFYSAVSTSRRRPHYWTIDWLELVFGLYPSNEDLACFTQLFMARTGWNPSTVYSLDISYPEWASPIPGGGMDLWRLQSWKERSKDWQDTVCRGRVTTGPYHIVNAVLERTKRLRELIRSQPDRLSVGEVRDAIKTPWLCANNTNKGLSGTVSAMMSDASTSFATQWWRGLVKSYNEDTQAFNRSASDQNKKTYELSRSYGGESASPTIDGQKQQSPLPVVSLRALIPESMTQSDWRHIYASFTFAQTRFSWLLTQWALGHKHVKTTRGYLRKRLWRKYSERRFNEAQARIFEQLEIGELDFTVLRARLDFEFEPTEADLKRLAAFRETVKREEITPSGYVCTTPFSPPVEMDPGNPGDGTVRARCGNRCAFCPMKGMAVDASYLVRILVSLRKVRSEMSLIAWSESQYPEELAMIERDLRQWPAQEIEMLLSEIEASFAEGRNRPQIGPGLN